MVHLRAGQHFVARGPRDRILIVEDGRIAHDVTVDIPRPRERGLADLAALEGSILRQLLKTADNP